MNLKTLTFYLAFVAMTCFCAQAALSQVEVSLSNNIKHAKSLSGVLDVYVSSDSGNILNCTELEIKLEHSIYGNILSGYFLLTPLDSFSAVIKASDSSIIATANIDSRFFLDFLDKGKLPHGRYYMNIAAIGDSLGYSTTQSFYIAKTDSAIKKKKLFTPYLDIVSNTNYSYYAGAPPPNNARDAYMAVSGGVNVMNIPFGINMLLTSDYQTVNFGYTPVFMELNSSNFRKALEDRFMDNIKKDRFKMQFSQKRLEGLMKQKDKMMEQLEALKKKLPDSASIGKMALPIISADSMGLMNQLNLGPPPLESLDSIPDISQRTKALKGTIDKYTSKLDSTILNDTISSSIRKGISKAGDALRSFADSTSKVIRRDTLNKYAQILKAKDLKSFGTDSLVQNLNMNNLTKVLGRDSNVTKFIPKQLNAGQIGELKNNGINGSIDSLKGIGIKNISGIAGKVVKDSALLKRITKLETGIEEIDQQTESLKKVLGSLDVTSLTKDYKDPAKIKNAISGSKYFKKAERLLYSVKNLKLGSFSVNGSKYFMSSTPFLGAAAEFDWKGLYIRAQAGVIQGNGKFIDKLKKSRANVFVAGLGYHASEEKYIHVLLKRTIEKDSMAESTKKILSKNFVLGYESAFSIKEYLQFKSELFLCSYSSSNFENGIPKEGRMLLGLFVQKASQPDMGTVFATNNSLVFHLGKHVDVKYLNNIVHPYFRNTGNFISAQNLNQHSAQVKTNLFKNALKINAGFDYITQLIPERQRISVYRANGGISAKWKSILVNAIVNYSINGKYSESLVYNLNLTKQNNFKYLLLTNILYFSGNNINQDTLNTMIGTVGHNFQVKYKQQWHYSNSTEFRWGNGLYQSKTFTWRGNLSFVPKPGITLNAQPNILYDLKRSTRIGGDISMGLTMVKNLELAFRCGYGRYNSFSENIDFHQISGFVSCNYKL